MPSSPLPVRPVLAALLTALLAIAPMLATAALTPSASALTRVSPQPAAPSEPAADAPAVLDLESLTPTALAAGGTLTARVTVTNTSSSPITAPQLDLRTRGARVTDRGTIAEWQARTEVDTTGGPVDSSSPGQDLAPGQSATLQVSASSEELGYKDQPYFWGTRRISLTLSSEGTPLASLYTFVVWRPAGAQDAVTQSVLLPVATLDPSAPITAPDAFAETAESGRLANLVDLAVRDDVDWWMDPALLDPPLVAADTAGGGGAPVTDPADPADGEASPTPTVPAYEPHPVAAPLAATLQENVGERTVLAMPYAHADRVALEAAGTDALSAAVTEAGQQAWQEAGIEPHGDALATAAQQTRPETLETMAKAGASTLIVPSSSLRTDPSAPVTPSSVGSYATDAGPRTVLAPDPVLSDEFSLLTGTTDTEQTRQRLLAETATIASEFTTAPRHLLIAPDPGTALDAQAAGSVLDTLAEAPWIRPGRTADLMDAAQTGEWTTQTQDESGAMLTLGEIAPQQVQPTGPDEIGTYTALPRAEPLPLTSRAVLEDLAGSWERLDRLGTAMQDDAALDGPRLMALSGTSVGWRGMSGAPAERARETGNAVDALLGGIRVQPASGYNLISDSAGVPITLSNDLDTPLTVRTSLSSDRPLVRISEEQPEVTIPAHGQADIAVPVEAIANGTVQLTVGVTTVDGRPLTEPVEVPLTVNPAWENWTTLLLVIAMGILVVVGVTRARRTGATTRAPGVHVPEDPVELSRSGLSRPARLSEPASPAPSGGPAEPSPEPDDRTETQEDRA